jgi:hypothetical protein
MSCTGRIPHTFWDCEKCYGNDGISMCTPDIIVGISDQQIYRVILDVPCRHRYRGLVAPEDDWTIHCPLSSRVRCEYLILEIADQYCRM